MHKTRHDLVIIPRIRKVTKKYARRVLVTRKTHKKFGHCNRGVHHKGQICSGAGPV